MPSSQTGERPAHLIRFYGNLDFALECIEERKLALPHVKKLNDPFDPPAFLLMERPADVPANFIRFVEAILRRDLYAPVFMACFSNFKLETATDEEKQDLLYMWSHYANGHRGVAFEFDTTILKKSLEAHYSKIPSEGNIIRVNYGSPPLLTVDEVKDFKENYISVMNKISQTLLCKTPNWEPEREWRVMCQDAKTDLNVVKIPLKRDAISKVFIGLNCACGNTKKIIRQTRRSFPNAKIYKAIRQLGTLNLEYRESKNAGNL